MNTIRHGIKNAFRNITRTISVVVILAISIGLALIMFVSYQAINLKISSVKQSIGNVITLTPPTSQGFEGGGSPLTQSQVNNIKNLPYIKNIQETLLARITQGSGNSLKSAITAGTLGRRFHNASFGGGTNPNPNFTFTIPIEITGLSSNSSLQASGVSLTSGSLFNPSSSSDVAVVGKNLASENNLKVGSSFTAYGKTITVSGIIDMGTKFENDSFYMPIAALQTISSQSGDISTAVITVDSISDVTSTINSINSKLGSGNVGITSTQSSAQSAIAPLNNIRTITLYSLIGALIAGIVITLLIMTMIVRERRKEIGVLKAIGASNMRILFQFITESLVFTIIASILGMIFGIILANPVLSSLVSGSKTSTSSTSNSSSSTGIAGRFGPRGGGFARFFNSTGTSVTHSINVLSNIHAFINLDIILYGFLAALIIAIIGSSIPALIISKISPAEVLRGE